MRHALQLLTSNLPDFHLPVGPFARGKRPQPFAPEAADSIVPNVQALLVPDAAYARPNRVAAWTGDAGLLILTPGDPKPIAQLKLSQSPTGIAWSNNGPLLWGGSLATLAPADSGNTTWTFDLSAAPALPPLVPGNDPDAAATEDAAQNQNGGNVIRWNGRVLRLGPNQRGRIVNGRLVIVGNGQIAQLPAPPNDAAKDAAKPAGRNVESITSGRPLGASDLLSTSSGRVIVLDSATGAIRWQSRAADGALDRVLADDDFVVAYKRDDSASAITVYDAFTGQVIGRRTFDDPTRQPTNVALGGDGTLAFAMQDRIVLKNLFEPWSTADREITIGDDNGNNNNGQGVFAANLQPGQLLISDGRVLALSDQNTMLRVFDEETGKADRFTPVGSSKAIDLVLPTSAKPGAAVMIELVGSHAYLIGAQSLMAYDLDHPEQSWHGSTTNFSHDTTTDAFVGQDYLVLLVDGNKRVNAGKTAEYQLQAFSRMTVDKSNPTESGKLEFWPKITSSTGITDVMPTDGGFCYRTADAKLHWLRGTR